MLKQLKRVFKRTFWLIEATFKLFPDKAKLSLQWKKNYLSTGRTLGKGTKKNHIRGREMNMQQTNCGIV